MRSPKHLLIAAMIAAGTLIVGATPSPASAEEPARAEAAVLLPDGTYEVYNNEGQFVGWMVVRGGEITFIEYRQQEYASNSQ